MKRIMNKRTGTVKRTLVPVCAVLAVLLTSCFSLERTNPYDPDNPKYSSETYWLRAVGSRSGWGTRISKNLDIMMWGVQAGDEGNRQCRGYMTFEVPGSLIRKKVQRAKLHFTMLMPVANGEFKEYLDRGLRVEVILLPSGSISTAGARNLFEAQTADKGVLLKAYDIRPYSEPKAVDLTEAVRTAWRAQIVFRFRVEGGADDRNASSDYFRFGWNENNFVLELELAD